MTSNSGHVMASGDHGSSSTVPVTSAISEAGLRNETPAHTPSPPRPAPEDVRKPLAQPPLHAARRHQDQLFGERVGQRVGQQGTEPVGQQISALGTVQMKRHRGPP